MPAIEQQNRDLTLAPDTYLYLQNEGKGGVINVFKGPAVVNQTGQDKPVRYDPATRKYHACSLDQAVQQCPRAAEGDYVIIENPSEDGTFPKESNNSSKNLKRGRKIVIPGPWSEALYPGQSATVIEGHRLRSNQYIVAIIYNAEEAEKNWESGSVVKPQQASVDDHQLVAKYRGLPKPESFAVGTRIVIRGCDVSFYIPCTGVEVLQDDKNRKYVRDAVTLEQLEYCCLIDESGKKQYPRGPQVVFPSPTQIIEEDAHGRRKFRPIELNSINGIHLKVTADFEDEDLERPVGSDGKRPIRKYIEGTELFVTGKTLQIYYPREELAIIEYGKGMKKHFSTAIPTGEGRYVINRETGEIRLERGPAMFLADPRTEIPVRRILSVDECSLWYPGNQEAIAYNLALSEAMSNSPSGRSGLVSEGDWRKAASSRGPMMEAYRSITGDTPIASMAFSSPDSYVPESVGEEGGSTATTSATRYTPPRTLTLNTKYDGAPRINVFSGYAVLVVGADGSRRVVKGPELILLEYHEKLGYMELSTGKPKSTDKLMKTAYLCIQNNQVGDIVPFESKDHVRCKVKISLRVNFEAESPEDELRWFSVDNYVKNLTDHTRSILAGMAKRFTIAEIKDRYVDLIRDAILGQKTENGRPGLYFADNSMRVIEVEVLDLQLEDQNIAKMLSEAQIRVVSSNIELERARKDLEAAQEKQRIEQLKLEAEHNTESLKIDLKTRQVNEQLVFSLAQSQARLKDLESSRQVILADIENIEVCHQAELSRNRSKANLEIEIEQNKQNLLLEKLDLETKNAVERLNAAKDGLYEVLVAMQREDLATKLAAACNIERYLSGDNWGSSVSNILSQVPTLKQFWEKSTSAIENRNRLKPDGATTQR